MRTSQQLALTEQEKRILARTRPWERTDLEQLLVSVRVLIKEARGAELTEEERTVPRHPLLSPEQILGGNQAAETLQRRLDLVDRYQLRDGQLITEILSFESALASDEGMSARKARLMLELYENPRKPQYALAKRLRTTPRTLDKELEELRRDFSFQVFALVDMHKFGLAYSVIYFRTKSLLHSKTIEAVIRSRRGFFRGLQFDNDYRRGILAYTFPDSPRGHQLFNQLVEWLKDEYFETCYVARVEGFHYYVSFNAYDAKTNSFLIETDAASDAAVKFVREHQTTIPRPEGFFFTKPFRFAPADFLLAHMQYWNGRETSVEFRRAALMRYGIDLSKKAIWRREQRLWRMRAIFPLIQFRIPGFDEQVALSIRCTEEAREVFRLVPSIFPYAFVLTADVGCMVLFQQPSRFAAATGQLVRAISRDDDVNDVDLYRFHWVVTPAWVLDIISHWDVTRQSWNLEEGDI
jgi:hypothetical protein